MLNLLTSPRTARTVRAVLGSLAGTVTEFAIKAADTWATVTDDTETPTVVEPVEAPEPAGLFTEAELPELADIEAAAASYDEAADQARAADRSKRRSRKLLDRLPAGTYGQWLVRRVASNRQTVDLEAVRAIFQAHGLGDVPMRDNAPSLKVEQIASAPATVETLTVVAA
ncbi:hypothetical protein [Streptomyces sp. NPDC055085]